MPGKNLTRQEARDRALLVDVDSYAVSLDLTSGPTTFGTRSTIAFSAATPGADTFVDFLGDSVQTITLNGVALDPKTHYDGARVSVPGLAARNELVIEATGTYMNTGEGLHRFVDPTDDEVYLYSQFEVADSRRMFPVFEQPDLKATFAFTVRAPKRWAIISNQPTPDATPSAAVYTNPKGEQEPSATWTFEPTERISCYITALIAGPYDVVRDSVASRGGTIPLGIYCRRSLSPHLDAEHIFDCTKRGFAYFEEQFDQPYPFSKYDQIFTPEYNMGAMENAGAVTITETYIFRAKVSEALIERRALTILHELAHMWFGNLVTMTWWDDLWLNESFAEWAANICQAEATHWTGAWTTFSSMEKTWAYNQDQLSSTHPVYADMATLDDVDNNFDGITYAKGASVLKQLVAYVGRTPFIGGLRAYFAKHQWGNTVFEDLLTELEATSGRDLGGWSKTWLQTAGVNTLRPVIQTDDDGAITRAVIEQTASADHPTLRPHRLVVGLYTLQGHALQRTEHLELDVEGASTTLDALVGKQAPDLILVNDDDLSYTKIRLDPRSLQTLLDHPDALSDPLARALAQGAVWDMTRDAEMGARQFLHLALAALPGETGSAVRRMWLTQARTAASAYTAPEHRKEAIDDVTKALRSSLVAATPGSDAQLQVCQAFATLAHRHDDVAYVRGLLEGTAKLAGLEIDSEMRWTLLRSLAAAGALDDREVDAELRADPTSTGKERAAQVRAAYPTAEAKAEAWRQLVEVEGVPNQTVMAIAAGFGHVHDPQLLAPYVEKYHAMLTHLWEHRTFAIASGVATFAYPSALASRELLDASNAWLAQNADAPHGLARIVAENRDGVARALRAQARDAQA
ncbi:aminopeptidase N [Leekyejoonella antrihumi]|uniref:Aminopeptidase N n=1 Tax=Leekyejoonella antrihumi TaxID=1660198 RepID=A0A563E530_9MICO|nr:aminopeptidase N [Leekyejoonella antrihumi]TWP37668.1 aminopeptidase N [Leekyejoonella antrihumi]